MRIKCSIDILSDEVWGGVMKFCEKYDKEYEILKDKNITLDLLWQDVKFDFQEILFRRFGAELSISDLADFYQRSPLNGKRTKGMVKRMSWNKWWTEGVIDREEAFLLPLYLDYDYEETENFFQDVLEEDYWPKEIKGKYDLHEVILHYSVLFEVGIVNSFELYQKCSRNITRARRNKQDFGDMKLAYRALCGRGVRNDSALIELVTSTYGQYHLNEKGEAKIEGGEKLKKFLEKLNEEELIDKMYDSPYNLKKSEFFRKKIYTWQNQGVNIERSYAFLLCFYLGLSYDDSREFIEKELFHRWIHTKNLDEVLYDMGLRAGLDIEDVYELREEFLYKITKHDISRPTMDILTQFKEYSTLLENKEKKEQLTIIREYLENNLSDFSFRRNSLLAIFENVMKNPNTSLKYVNNMMNGSEKKAISRVMLAEKLSDMKLDEDYKDNCDDKVRAYENLIRDYERKNKEVSREDLLCLFIILGYVDIDEINNMLEICSLPRLSLRVPLDLFVCYYVTHLDKGHDLCEYIAEAIEKYLGDNKAKRKGYLRKKE